MTNISFCVVIPENKPCLRKFPSAAVLKGKWALKKAFVYHGAGKRGLENIPKPSIETTADALSTLEESYLHNIAIYDAFGNATGGARP